MPIPEELSREIGIAIADEVSEGRRDAGRRRILVRGVEPLAQQGSSFTYRLLATTASALQADAPLRLQIPGRATPAEATLVHQDDDGLTIQTDEAIPPTIRSARLSTDPAFILEALRRYLRSDACVPGPAALALMEGRLLPPAPQDPALLERLRADSALNESQARAIATMLASPMTFLWGPPGTGKTATLGRAIPRWVEAGKTVLILAPTNVAVDALVLSAARQLGGDASRTILRIGVASCPEAEPFTAAGHVVRNHPEAAAAVEQARRAAKPAAGEAGVAVPEGGPTPAEARTLLSAFRETCRNYERDRTVFHSVVAATLSRLALSRELQARRFDVVVVDEASMVSIPFALAAACCATASVVFAGDPRQLPPICQAEWEETRRWMGRNLYAWLDVEGRTARGETGAEVPFLDTQYRMAPAIGDTVSRGSYAARLRHGRTGGPGTAPIVVDTAGAWEKNGFCVESKSWYHYAIVPILHALMDEGALGSSGLLLTPFRPQRELLAGLAKDLRARQPDADFRASTIHRSQGSEAPTVVVDLTSHDPLPTRFFADPDAARLVNVAVSRARDRLVLVGSSRMLAGIGSRDPLWNVLRELFLVGAGRRTLADVVDRLPRRLTLGPADVRPTPGDPTLYSHGDGPGSATFGVALLRGAKTARKVAIGREPVEEPRDVIYREDPRRLVPRLFLCGGSCYLPWGVGWLEVRSPEAARVLARLAAGHLIEGEGEEDAAAFACPECGRGTLAVRHTPKGWLLQCTGGAPGCPGEQRVSKADATRKARLAGVLCGRCGSPVAARSARHGLFLGCENYPRCDWTGLLDVLAGV
jgi:hypothetical protein